VPPPAPERDPELSDGRKKALEALAELSAAADKRVEEARARVDAEVADPAAAKAKVIPDPTRKLGFRGKGVSSGTVKLRAKSRVTISGVAPWAEGAWYVTKVNHVYRRQFVGPRLSRHTSYVTNFQVTR
jgi:hypothetical protein